MKRLNKPITIIGIIVLVLGGLMVWSKASPTTIPSAIKVGSSYQIKNASSCTATTSPNIQNGKNTVTLPGGFSQVSTDFFIASTTTVPTVTYNYEVSENGIDWYAIFAPITTTASTTNLAVSQYNLPLISTSSLGTSGHYTPTTTWWVQTPTVQIVGTQARLQYTLSRGLGVCVTPIIVTEVR